MRGPVKPAQWVNRRLTPAERQGILLMVNHQKVTYRKKHGACFYVKSLFLDIFLWVGSLVQRCCNAHKQNTVCVNGDQFDHHF